MALEPALATTGALFSPSTGIIDSHAYMLTLLGDAQNSGATLVLNSPVLGGRIEGGGIILEVGGVDPVAIRCKLFVNAAGLQAPPLARKLKGLPPNLIPSEYYAKGNYFSLSGKSPFSRLIYPVPVKGGLGVHLTLDMGGQARFGPDVEWVSHIDHDVDPRRGDSFYASVRRYYPDLKQGTLQRVIRGSGPR